MRIITDIHEARALLTRRPGFEEPVLPPAAAKRTEAIFGEPLTATEAVRRILADVRERGDDAVRDYAKRIDGNGLRELEVPRAAWKQALGELQADLVDAMRTAASRIRAYAEASMPRSWHDQDAGYGQRHVPIERVGLYVPGGSAAYPSTVLMSVVPAKVAGVPQVVVCTPDPSPATLAAAHVAGADRLFAIGGAQAIGALAYGTATVPKVDKICGPGNVFVSIAKREVYGAVDIDGLYGPTETLVIADETADPVIAAADLLAQAEHDELASPVLIATDLGIAERIAAEVDRQLAALDRRAIAAAAVERNGMAVVAGSVGEAIELANAFAPEHLCLLVRDAPSYVDAVRNAGGIFVGEHSPEVLGDYVAGPSHVMPTGGTARFASSLGVHTFLRYQPIVRLSQATLTQIGPAAAALARTEGLTAHARAIELRLEGQSARHPASGDPLKAGKHLARDLVLPHLRSLEGYEAVDPPEVLAERAGIPVSEIVKLDANENPYGPSSRVAEALASLEDAHLYPDPAQSAMREAVSRYIGLAPEHVVVGNGSDEIIDLLFRAVLGPGDAVVNSVPTFGMYEFTAQVCHARTVAVERDDAFRIDVDGVLAAAGEQGAKIIAVASPNNPSGNGTPPEDIERLLASGCLVIVDEAYAEFGGTSVAALVPERSNLVVLRTLSKWAGLAGLRVGYGLMDLELAEVLMRAKPPYNVNQAAEAALLASLADAEALQERVRLIVAERERMRGLLDALPGLTPLPSDANFILCRLPDGRGNDVHERLARRGVFVRYYARGVLTDYLRISAGTPSDTDRLIAALAEALQA